VKEDCERNNLPTREGGVTVEVPKARVAKRSVAVGKPFYL